MAAHWVIAFGVMTLAFSALMWPEAGCPPFAGNQEVVRRDLATMGDLLERHAMENEGEYPPALVDVFTVENGLVPRTTPVSDPWRRPYRYELHAGRRGYRLVCLGSDGVVGGRGDAQDFFVASQ